MNTRERKKEKEKLEIEAYEANLKLHYESVKNELDTLIRATIPLQMSSIKTVLWFNIVLFGFALQIIDKFSITSPLFVGTAMTATCISIGFALKAMIIGGKIHYGNYLKRTYMMSIPDDKWAKVNGIHRMFYDISRAVRYNGIVTIKRKRYIRLAMISSMASMIYFVILIYINFIQGQPHAKQTATSSTAKESIRGENSERSKTWTGSKHSATPTKEINVSVTTDKNITKLK